MKGDVKMKKKSENSKISENSVQQGVFFDKAIADFIEDNERMAAMMDHDISNVSLTVRINVAQVVVLDDLAKKWRRTRSNIAADMLERMVFLVFKKLHEEKTEEEFSQLWNGLVTDYMEKHHGTKRGKK
jgi:hypothetical protein